jgi:hypothetical protein
MKTRRSLFHIPPTIAPDRAQRSMKSAVVEKKDGRLEVVLSLADL